MGTMKAILLLALPACALAASLTLGGKVGGIEDFQTDLSDPNVQFAVKAINDFYNDDVTRTATKLVSASKQVVAGELLTFVIEMSTDTSSVTCSVIVWSRAWMTGSDAMMLQGSPQCSGVTPAPSA